MKRLKEILDDPAIFATTALAIVIQEFGTVCLEWDPNAWEIELQKYLGKEPEDDLLDRLQAGISVLTSNSLFLDVYAFTAVCNSLNRGVILSDTWIPADLDDVLWAVTEIRMLLGDSYSEEEYSADVKRYVGVLLQQEGIKKVPSVLGFAEIDEDLSDTYEAYSGDEIMSQAFTESQIEDRNNLEKYNIAILEEYMQQLSTLPIKSDWLEDLQASVLSS